MIQQKANINLVVIGHDSSGISTTVGCLIFKCGGIDKRTIEELQRENELVGQNKIDYSKIFYKLKKCAEEAIINIFPWTFQSFNYRFTILDTSINPEFMQNMIRGYYEVHVALILISAKDGEFENDIKKAGLINARVLLAYNIGIKQIIVGVNKMDDSSVLYSQARFEEIRNQMSQLLKKIGYKPSRIQFVSISGLLGENLVERSENME